MFSDWLGEMRDRKCHRDCHGLTIRLSLTPSSPVAFWSPQDWTGREYSIFSCSSHLTPHTRHWSMDWDLWEEEAGDDRMTGGEQTGEKSRYSFSILYIDCIQTVYRLYTDCIALIYDPLPSGLASPLTWHQARSDRANLGRKLHQTAQPHQARPSLWCDVSSLLPSPSLSLSL